MSSTPDDLGRLLHTVPGGPPPAAARARMLAASTRTLRRWVWLRRSATTVGVAAVFGLGMAAGWTLKPTSHVASVEPPAVEPTKVDPPAQPHGLSAGELEVKAELSDDRAEVARLYREAGDKYLADHKDYAQAARCYRLHLLAADPEARKASAEDSWLLLTMKETQ